MQKCKAQSTMRVEYVAVLEAVKEVIWLDKLMFKMRLKQRVINLHCDSQSALYLASNQMMKNNKIKHIDIMYHFIRHVVFDKSIELVKIYK